MAKNWKKQFNTRDNVRYEIRDGIKRYVNMKKDFNAFMELREKIMSKYSVNTLPRYEESALYAYWDACMTLLVESSLIFVYMWTDNRFYTIKELETREDFSHKKLAELNTFRGSAWDNNNLFFVTDNDGNHYSK